MKTLNYLTNVCKIDDFYLIFTTV